MTRTVVITTTGLLIIAIFLFLFLDNKYVPSLGEKVQVIEQWELPGILKEISGIAYLGNDRMACIQDEEGIIFIYNLQSRQIQREIRFAGDGDYESITIAAETAYVLRSDGTIYEVREFLSENPETIEHRTQKTSGRDFEGLAYDKKNNRLLLSLKEGSGKDSRPVYAFNLDSKNLAEEPVIQIAFSDPIFSDLGKKPSEKFLRPSEISIHPETNKIYLLESIEPKILLLNEDGTPGKLHILDLEQFVQAEGLCFGDNGDIYISNEGKGTPPNILKISLN